jgi:hypothetical protein
MTQEQKPKNGLLQSQQVQELQTQIADLAQRVEQLSVDQAAMSKGFARIWEVAVRYWPEIARSHCGACGAKINTISGHCPNGCRPKKGA